MTIGIEPQSEHAGKMLQAVRNIVNTFNALTPTTGNIRQLGGADSYKFDFESLALHEVGHALGLGHPSLGGCQAGAAKYTNAKKDGPSYTLNPGNDGIRGSQDDVRGKDVNIHWFFQQTNSPFALEDVVDKHTYARSAADLPRGHAFAANGNRKLAEHMGFMDTEAAMYWFISAGEVKRTLIHDDVATLKYAMSGRVWLFFVDGPGGFCKRHGKSYLTRRRRGGEGGGGGSLTGGAVRAAYRWA